MGFIVKLLGKTHNLLNRDQTMNASTTQSFEISADAIADLDILRGLEDIELLCVGGGDVVQMGG